MERNRTLLAGKVFLITNLVILLFILFSGLIIAVLFSSDSIGEDAFIYLQTVMPIIIAIPSLLAIKKYKLYSDFIGFSNFKIRDVILSIVAVLFAYPLIVAITSTIVIFFGENVDSVSQTVNLMGSLPLSYLPLILLSFAILPAIFEEIQFRGLYAGCYKRSGYFKAALVTSLMFSLIHMNLVQFGYTFILGIVFYYIRVATGSLFIPMILHFLVNGFAVVTSFIQNSQEIFKESNNIVKAIKIEETTSTNLIELLILYLLGIIGIFISFKIIRYIAKLNGNNDVVENFYKKGSQKIFSVSLLIAIMISVIIMLLNTINLLA